VIQHETTITAARRRRQSTRTQLAGADVLRLRSHRSIQEVRMSKPPLPDAAIAMLRKPNPAVITTLRDNGQPVSMATWYLWDDGRVLVNMDESRKRLEHMRGDPRIALDVLDESNWYTHVSITGHIEDLREDTALADIDRIALHYTDQLYAVRDRRRISAWIAVDGWYGWGALKDS
jgi:PPOX class probable F420-dependent enzyme